MISNFYVYFAAEQKYVAKSDFIPVLRMIVAKFLAQKINFRSVPLCVDPVSVSYWYAITRSAAVSAKNDFQTICDGLSTRVVDEQKSEQLLAKIKEKAFVMKCIRRKEAKLKFWHFKAKSNLHKEMRNANEDIAFEDAIQLVYWMFLKQNAGTKSEFKSLVLSVLAEEYRPLC